MTQTVSVTISGPDLERVFSFKCPYDGRVISGTLRAKQTAPILRDFGPASTLCLHEFEIHLTKGKFVAEVAER